jgi:magnesium transporter
MRPAARPDGRRGRTVPAMEHATAAEAVIDCAVYRGGRREPGSPSYADAVPAVRAHGGFVWIGLYEPDERALSTVAAEFGLHPLAVEDAVHAHQRPKLERYGDLLFAVFKTVRYCPHDQLTPTTDVVRTGELMVFTGTDFVITVRHGSHGGLADLRHRLERNAKLLDHGPTAVLYAIADQVVDDYLDVAARVRTDVEELENAVFAARQRRDDIERTYQLKREVIELRRAVEPLHAPIRRLAENADLVPDTELRQYFRDVDDHLSRVREQVSGYDELLTTILQASLARIQVSMNEDMRRISAWVAIVAVPTMIAGIYGMNFEHMPELHWRYGYPLAIAGILAVCGVLHRGFRRNGWL